MCAGQLDASVHMGRSLSTPRLGGWLRFSKGTLLLLPHSTPAPADATGPPPSGLLDTAFRAAPPAAASAGPKEYPASTDAANAATPALGRCAHAPVGR